MIMHAHLRLRFSPLAIVRLSRAFGRLGDHTLVLESPAHLSKFSIKSQIEALLQAIDYTSRRRMKKQVQVPRRQMGFKCMCKGVNGGKKKNRDNDNKSSFSL